MAFLSSYLRKLAFNQGAQGVQGTTNSTQGLQGIQGVQGNVGIAGTTLLTNTQSGTYTLQRGDIGEVVSGVSTIGFSSNTFNPGESVIILNNNLNQTILNISGANPAIKFYEEGVSTATTFSRAIKNKSFVNVLCTRINEFILGGSLVDAPIVATGGTTIDSGGFRIHVFTSPGPFNITFAAPAATVEYVVVGGGGGSQAATPLYSGGGGAGGFRTGTNFPVTVQDYPITVGLGSTAGIATAGNSIFSTITSTGGGRGNNAAGSNGGSGGGGGTVSPSGVGLGNTPPTTPPQGNNGGAGSPPTVSIQSGGGGGAGANGSSINGGIGSPITWIPASYGTPGPAPGRYFAGGGAGRNSISPTGTSGAGGGGAYGTPGTTNTGGGGGGNNTTGGPGIVIIRYPIL